MKAFEGRYADRFYSIAMQIRKIEQDIRYFEITYIKVDIVDATPHKWNALFIKGSFAAVSIANHQPMKN